MSENNSQFTLNSHTILISYFTQFLQYGVAILVLPIVLHRLTAVDMGIWYLFLSIFSMVSLLDFGFGPSIQRSAAYVFSGATELLEEGFKITKSKTISYSLLKSLLYTSKNIYKKISIGILLLALILGTVYLYFSLKDKFTTKLVCTWILYIFSISFNFYYGYILSFIKGRGLINKYNIIILASKSAYIVSLYVFVLLDWGLLSLVLANFINTFLIVFLGKKIVYDKNTKKQIDYIGDNYEDIFPIIWKNAKNSGIVGIGVFLFSQAGVFLSGLFLSLDVVAQLGLTLQIFSVIVVMSRVYLYTSVPKISSMWITGEKEKISMLFLRSQLIGYSIFFISVAIMLLFGNWLLKTAIHSNVLLPSMLVTSLYALFNFMELTHGNCCTIISTTNNIPFTKASLIAGVISVISTLIFIKFNLGMVSFPLGLICGSLPYNSWKWPLETYKIFKTTK